MSRRLITDRRNVQRIKGKWEAASTRTKVTKKQSQRVAKERLAKLYEALIARIEPHLEQVDLPATQKDMEPEDELLAARVEALHKQLGEVSARVLRLREEVPALVERVVARELQDASTIANVPATPAEITVPAPLPQRLRAGVEKNYSDLVATLAKFEKSYPATLEKAQRIKSVAEQRAPSRTEAVIQQEQRATVASPRTGGSRKSPSKRR